MTDEQKAAFIQSQTACMLAELEAMKAENKERRMRGLSDAYNAQAFSDLADHFGLGHNTVVSFFAHP